MYVFSNAYVLHYICIQIRMVIAENFIPNEHQGISNHQDELMKFQNIYLCYS